MNLVTIFILLSMFILKISSSFVSMRCQLLPILGGALIKKRWEH